jgi:flavorubredoxin
MYGMTKKAVDAAVKVLKDSGIRFNVFQVPETPIGTILASAWTSTGIIIAAPAYEAKMFPPMASTVDELGRKKVLNRKVVMFGSYGWSKGALKELNEINDRMRMNWEIIDSVEFNGRPDDNAIENVKVAVSSLIDAVRDAIK